MDNLEINEASTKYPVLDYKIKQFQRESYIKSYDETYNIVNDIENKINEIYKTDLEEHKDEMNRICQLLKEDGNNLKGKYDYYISNDNIKSKNEFLYFSDQSIENVKAMHYNKELELLLNSNNSYMISNYDEEIEVEAGKRRVNISDLYKKLLG